MLIDAAAPAVTAASRLVRIARNAVLQVIHCVVRFRADFKGSAHNSVLARRARKEAEAHLRTAEERAAFAEVVPEIGVEPEDLVYRTPRGFDHFAETMQTWAHTPGEMEIRCWRRAEPAAAAFAAIAGRWA